MINSDCVFCNIIAGKIPSHKIYEDEQSFAFLDLKPINPGHVLVIPKLHEPVLYNLPDKSYQSLMATVKKLSKKVQEKMLPKKVGLIVAGFDVQHVHVHIVPMVGYHDITSEKMLNGTLVKATEEELVEVEKQLTS